MGAGSRTPLSTIGQRPPSASDRTSAPISRKRVEDAAHRPLAQRGVAVEGRGDRRGRRRRPSSAASRCRRCRSRACRAGRKQRAEARARGCASGRAPRRSIDRAERLAGLARPQDVVALEQALDHRLAAGQEAEDEGAMGNRLVAGRAEPPLERPARASRSTGEAERAAAREADTSELAFLALAPGRRRGAP